MGTVNIGLEELRKRVGFVKHATGSSKTDLATLLVRFSLEEKKLTLACENKELVAQVIMPVDWVPEEGEPAVAFGILAGKLDNFTNIAAAEKIAISWDSESSELKAGFLTVSLEHYDSLGIRNAVNAVASQINGEGEPIDRALLEEALSTAKLCTTTSSVRPDVNHVEMRQGALLASDGRKIMIYRHPGFPENAELKVPAGVLTDTTSAVKNMTAETLALTETPSHYVLLGDNGRQMLAIRAGQNAQLEISTTNALGRRSHEHTQCGRVTNGEISWPVSFKHLIDCTQALKNADDVITMQVMQDRSFLIFAEDSKERTIRTFVPFRTDQAIEQERAEAAKLAKDKPKEAVATEGAPTRDTDEDIDIE
jgi:hypothetical protein